MERTEAEERDEEEWTGLPAKPSPPSPPSKQLISPPKSTTPFGHLLHGWEESASKPSQGSGGGGGGRPFSRGGKGSMPQKIKHHRPRKEKEEGLSLFLSWGPSSSSSSGFTNGRGR